MRDLKSLRLRRGLSQADLSEKSGVSEFTISEIEAGKRPNARPSTARKLAAGIGVDVADLYGEAMPIPKAPELTLEDVGAFLNQEVGSGFLALPSEKWSSIEKEATAEQRRAIDREWALMKHEFLASHNLTEDKPRLVPRGGRWGDVYSELFARRAGISLGIPSSTAQAVVREAEQDALVLRSPGA